MSIWAAWRLTSSICLSISLNKAIVSRRRISGLRIISVPLCRVVSGHRSRLRLVRLVLRLEMHCFEDVVIALVVGDDVVTRANDFFSVQAVQNAMPLHDVATVGAESPPGNFQRLEMANHFAFGRPG